MTGQKRTCSTEGCERSAFARGWCQMHYAREWKSGFLKPIRGAHGMYQTAEWRAWQAMNSRCRNPDHRGYQHWGGRGITICDQWSGVHGFENFYADMGPRPSPRHSLDRIDNDGNYEPTNCRWATVTEQRRNQRRVRLMVTKDDRTLTLAEWSRETGISVKLIDARLRRGWSIDDALDPRDRRIERRL